MEAVCSFKMFTSTNHTTWHGDSKDNNANLHCQENLKSYINITQIHKTGTIASR